jgi:hypothetical protein
MNQSRSTTSFTGRRLRPLWPYECQGLDAHRELMRAGLTQPDLTDPERFRPPIALQPNPPSLTTIWTFTWPRHNTSPHGTTARPWIKAFRVTAGVRQGLTVDRGRGRRSSPCTIRGAEDRRLWVATGGHLVADKQAGLAQDREPVGQGIMALNGLGLFVEDRASPWDMLSLTP